MVFGFGLPKFSMKPSTVVKITSASAGSRQATRADKLVVVAELDFGEGNGVVLVDDRDDAVAQQRNQAWCGR